MDDYKIINQFLEYDPEKGIFTWIVSPSKIVSKGSVAGTVSNRGYVQLQLRGKKYTLHKMAWLFMYGSFPESRIDHINGDKTDNRICNLRLCTNSENMLNTGLQSNNTSGVKGVSWDKHHNKWIAYAFKKRKKIHLGRFEFFEDAVNARKSYVGDNYNPSFYRET